MSYDPSCSHCTHKKHEQENEGCLSILGKLALVIVSAALLLWTAAAFATRPALVQNCEMKAHALSGEVQRLKMLPWEDWNDACRIELPDGSVVSGRDVRFIAEVDR